MSRHSALRTSSGLTRPRLHNRRRPTLLALTLIMLFAVAVAVAGADAENDPLVLVFYEEGCPSCELVEELIAALAPDLPASSIRRYEISEPESFELLTRLAAAFEVEFETVPVVFVGEEAVIGAGRAAEFALRAAIGDCVSPGCPSPLDQIRPPSVPWSEVLRLGAFIGLLILLVILQPL
ncbi:hypothetical protein ACFLTM_01020 [Candidatus Bipolaricaulota bacterium]